VYVHIYGILTVVTSKNSNTANPYAKKKSSTYNPEYTVQNFG
jgi:hypothetical protein